ncbi:MAG: hydroxymethylglutaryl-CoA lyase [Caulobacteraceae bacterium]
MLIPGKVEVIEVGLRDGFQSIREWIPTEVKLEIIDGLVNAGYKKIQVTSFAHPKVIPQMKDSKEVAQFVVGKYPQVSFNALVPNLFGAKAAYDTGIRVLSYTISASEKYNMENVRRTTQESFEELKMIRQELQDAVIKVDINTAFGCPYTGKVPVEQILHMIRTSIALGADEIVLADTIGIANPMQVSNVIRSVKDKFPDLNAGLHFHDTRGMGLANVLAALQEGISKFDSSVGGLGGNPFVPGAAGNISSEDLVNMLTEMEIDTGVNLDSLLKTTHIVKDKIKNDLAAHMARF